VRDALLLSRWTTLAQWLLVAAAAYTGALAVNRAVAFWLDTGGDPSLKSIERGGARASRASEGRARDYALIFERNLFGEQPAPAPSSGGEALPATTAGALDLRLRGTAQVDDLGYAVIEDVAGSRQEVFVVGETIFEGPTLVAVYPAEAVIELDGRKQTLKIANAEPSAEGSKHSGRDKDKSGDGIRKTGDNSYLVDRREVEHSVDNLNELATQLRAVPYLKDGEAIGFRLFNIRRDSVFDRMGLKNGDVVQKVNGVELDSPTKALALLEDVQTTDEIRVDLLRGDSPSTMTYTVR